jgi:hypothetical protein
MHPHFALVDQSVLKICKYTTIETMLLAKHYYLSEQCDIRRSLGWGPTGLEIHGIVLVTRDELERIEKFIAAAEYSISVNNCEHFAKYVKYGLPISSQMDQWWKGLAAEAIALLQPTQSKGGNISDYVGKQASEYLKQSLRQARITRSNQLRVEFWKQRGIDLA